MHFLEQNFAIFAMAYYDIFALLNDLVIGRLARIVSEFGITAHEVTDRGLTYLLTHLPRRFPGTARAVNDITFMTL